MKLIFVYNARSGRINAAFDSVHKLVSPKTYACSLCAATHHPLGAKKRWTAFIERLPCEVEFLHRDEAQNRYAVVDNTWPQVLSDDGDRIGTWLSTAQLASAETLDQLESLIHERLNDETNQPM